MKSTVIHRSQTGRGGHWSPRQHYRGSLVEKCGGTTIRVTLDFDTSYADQCRATVANLVNGKFETLLTLYTHELPFVSWYHTVEKPLVGDMLRDGDTFEKRVDSTLDYVATKGFEILGKGVTH